MTRRIITTPDAPQRAAYGSGDFPYSQAVVAAGFVFVAGQNPISPDDGSVVGTTIQEQTRQCLSNIEAILVAAGSAMDKVVQVTFFLRDAADFAGMNEEWVRWFPVDPPTRQGARHWLDVEGIRIGIAALAEA